MMYEVKNHMHRPNHYANKRILVMMTNVSKIYVNNSIFRYFNDAEGENKTGPKAKGGGEP